MIGIFSFFRQHGVRYRKAKRMSFFKKDFKTKEKKMNTLENRRGAT